MSISEATLVSAEHSGLDRDVNAWRDSASCRSTHPDLFFPVGTGPKAGDVVDQAKAVCRNCSVRMACLEFALSTNQESGVWGGLAEEERRRMRRTWLKNRRLQRAG